MPKCDICGKNFEGYGNNPAPLGGKICCDNCNATYVIPARLKQLKVSNKLKDARVQEDTQQSFDLRGRIGFLVKDEVEAIDGYDDVLKNSCLSEEDVRVLEEIRNDELDHVDKLNGIYKKLVRGEIEESNPLAIQDDSNLEESFAGGYDPSDVNTGLSEEKIEDDLLDVVEKIGSTIGNLTSFAQDDDNLIESANVVSTSEEGQSGETSEEQNKEQLRIGDSKMTVDRMIQIITPIVKDFAKKNDVEDYWSVHKNGKNVSVGIELGYKKLDELCDVLNAKLKSITESYFEPADAGLIETTIFDSSVKDSYERFRTNNGSSYSHKEINGTEHVSAIRPYDWSETYYAKRKRSSSPWEIYYEGKFIRNYIGEPEDVAEVLEEYNSKIKSRIAKDSSSVKNSVQDSKKYVVYDMYDGESHKELLGYCDTIQEVNKLCNERYEDTDGECSLVYGKLNGDNYEFKQIRTLPVRDNCLKEEEMKFKDADSELENIAKIVKDIPSIFSMPRALREAGYKAESYDGVVFVKVNGKQVYIVSKNRADADPGDIVQGNYIIGFHDRNSISESSIKDSLQRYANTDYQETIINKLESVFRSLGINLRYGTSVGKSPQTVVLDIDYQDGAVYVPSSNNYPIEIYGEEIRSVDKNRIKQILKENNKLKDEKPINDADTVNDIGSYSIGSKYRWEEKYGNAQLTLQEICDFDGTIKLSLDNGKMFIQLPREKFEEMIRSGVLDNTDTENIEKYGSIKANDSECRDALFTVGETYTNSNGVKFTVLGTNKDVTGKEYVTYKLGNSTRNDPVEGIMNMLKENGYIKDSSIGDKSGEEFTTQQGKSKYEDEKKYNVKVGDKNYVVYAKDSLEAVNKLKNKLR